MRRNIAYWGATGLVGIVTLLAGFSYVTTAPEAVENFRHVGYPQQLRILLGIAKLAGAIVLLLPRLPTLKEWAYAGFTFMWSRQSWRTIWRATGPCLCCRSPCSGRWGFRKLRGRKIVGVPRAACVARQPTRYGGSDCSYRGLTRVYSASTISGPVQELEEIVYDAGVQLGGGALRELAGPQASSGQLRELEFLARLERRIRNALTALALHCKVRQSQYPRRIELTTHPA